MFYHTCFHISHTSFHLPCMNFFSFSPPFHSASSFVPSLDSPCVLFRPSFLWVHFPARITYTCWFVNASDCKVRDVALCFVQIGMDGIARMRIYENEYYTFFVHRCDGVCIYMIAANVLLMCYNGSHSPVELASIIPTILFLLAPSSFPSFFLFRIRTFFPQCSFFHPIIFRSIAFIFRLYQEFFRFTRSIHSSWFSRSRPFE